jgi:signal transduction histidine kinase
MMAKTEIVPTHPGLEALADGFCMLDADWRVAYWNAAAARQLGIAREAALGRGIWEVLPASVRPALDPHLRRAMQEREPAEFVIPHLPDCCPGSYSIRAAPADGGGIALHFRDTTDETKLAERYSHLIETLRDGFVAVDAHGGISYINQVAERLLRLRRGSALGSPIWALIPERPTEIADALRASLEDGAARQIRRIWPDAPVFRDHVYDLWIHPLPGGGLSVLFQDVTRRVQREKDLARFAAESEEANHAKSRFFAAVSHELRTPLNAIVGYTHLLTTDTYGEMPTSAVRAASRASVCAEHLAHLIDDLLLMTTAEIDNLPVVPEPLTFSSFLPTALEPIRQQVEAKGLRFTIGVDADVPLVYTDPGRLRQLLNLLLSNAVKFTSRGEVGVRVSALAAAPAADQNAPRPPPEANGYGRPHQDGAATAPGVRIRVIDTGPGIPAEARERIFEAFEQVGDDGSRTDSFRRGPGLGLSVARRLTDLLGGRLSLERTGGRGSVFRLDLPGGSVG